MNNVDDNITPSVMTIVTLLKAFGYTDNALPVGALLASYHGLSSVQAVLSPICWEATHNDAVMRESAPVPGDIFDAYQSFLAEENMKLYYHDANTWLLQCETHQLPDTKPLHLALEESMRPLLKALDKTSFWLRFLTEGQMCLSAYSHEVNGVWPWGGAALKPPSDKPLVVYDNAAWHRAACLLSNHVIVYKPDMRLPKKAVQFMPVDIKISKPFWMRYWSRKV